MAALFAAIAYFSLSRQGNGGSVSFFFFSNLFFCVMIQCILIGGMRWFCTFTGFKLHFHYPLPSLRGTISPIDSKEDKFVAKDLIVGDSDENAVVSEGKSGFMPEENGETITSGKLD